MFLAYLQQSHVPVKVTGSDVEAYDQGRVLSAHFNLVGGADEIGYYIREKLGEVKKGASVVVCIVGEDWSVWLRSKFIKEIATEFDRSNARATISLKDKSEAVTAGKLASYNVGTGTWAVVTWSLCSSDTFLTTQTCYGLSLIFLSSLPIFDARASTSLVDQLRQAIFRVTLRKLRCLEAVPTVSVVFQPNSLGAAFSSIVTVGRINRSFFTYKPSSASKLLAWKYRTQLNILDNISETLDPQDPALARFSMHNEQLSELVSQPSFAYEVKSSLLYRAHFEKYCIGHKQEESRPELPRQQGRNSSLRVVKYKGKLLRPATNYSKIRSSSKLTSEPAPLQN